MFELAIIVIGIILVLLMIPYLLWKFLISGSLQTALVSFFNTLHGKDLRVDPEAEIVPSDHQPISQVLEQEAEQFKQTAPITPTQVQQSDMPQASIPATTSQPKPKYNPPYRETSDTIEPATQQQSAMVNNDVIEAPVQPFVEDDTFGTDDPIIDSQYIDPDTPSADSLDMHIPESDSSPYGVRSAEHSPGRRLRDKRYRRNSS